MISEDNKMPLWDRKIEWLCNNVWYCVLLIGSTYYLNNNYYMISDLKEINCYNIVFIFWLFLLLYPLLSEFEFLGLKIKKEVEKVTKEQNGKIEDIKQDLYKMKMETAVNNQINLGLDGLLPKEILNHIFPNSNPKNIDDNIDDEESIKYIDNNNIYLFKVRASLEVMLHMLCEKYGSENRLNISQCNGWLVRHEVIDGYTSRLISEIIKIANRGVHGESISSEYVDFVKRSYPEVKKYIEGKIRQEEYIFSK